MKTESREPLLRENSSLQRYYHTLESRIGYKLVLGGTRHFGYYETDTYWPFPLIKHLRQMETHLFQNLQLREGALVLDAGCGVGHVAITAAAQHGLQIQGIDVVDHHLEKARRNVKNAGLEEQIKLRKADYHDLGSFEDNSFDGVYTVEAFVHATDPQKALREFFRVLKPGGSLALYEYDHKTREQSPATLQPSMDCVNHYAAMPANVMFDEGVLEKMLQDAGFRHVAVDDLSVNIKPMLRLFFVLAFLPYLIIKFLGLQSQFVNTVAGYQGYRGRKYWRYVAVTATKPVLGALPGSGEGERKRR